MTEFSGMREFSKIMITNVHISCLCVYFHIPAKSREVTLELPLLPFFSALSPI